MRGAVLREQHNPLVLADLRTPETLGAGQVRVRVHYSGICGSQVGEIDGVKGPDRFLPHLLGHEGCGTVLEVGDGVTTVRPDQRVVMHWMPGAGLESATPQYDWDGTTVNGGWVTTFNEEAIVSENRLTPAPDGIAPELVPLLGCAVTTGIGVVTKDAQLRVGESLVALGAGGVGLSVIQGAALAGAHPIIAVDLHESKLELASQLGATHRINAGAQDVAEAAREIVGPEGVDVVVENTGNPQVIEQAYELASAKGRVVLVGVPAVGMAARIHTLALHFGKRMMGSTGGQTDPPVDIPRYAALYRAGRLALDELVTNRYALEDINTAIADLREGRVAGRALIEIDTDSIEG